MVINTDTLTTIFGSIAAVSGTLSGYGIAQNYTTPVAGISGSLFAFFSKGITKTPSNLGN